MSFGRKAWRAEDRENKINWISGEATECNAMAAFQLLAKGNKDSTSSVLRRQGG